MIDYQSYIKLLQDLIATPSFSREEDKTADVIQRFFQNKNIPTERKGNNVWAKMPPEGSGLRGGKRYF